MSTDGRARADWQKLLRLEKDRRNMACEPLSLGADPASMGAPLREWWGDAGAIVRLLRVALEGGFVPDPPPLELLDILADMADTLATGKVPASMQHAASRGGKPAIPEEGRLIAIACAYLHAAGAGLVYAGVPITIADETPIKTIRTAYGVNRDTPHKWKCSFEAASLALFLGPNPISAATLTAFMREAGARYKAGYAQRYRRK
jgi:hypothetical protein